MSKSQDLIRYLAIGRPDKKTENPKHEILGSIVTQKGDPNTSQYEDHTLKIMGKAHKLSNGKRIRLTSDNDFEVHVQCEIDGNNTLLFIAITDTEFGVHHIISSFCEDWKSTFLRTVPRSEWGAGKSSLSTRVKTCLQTILAKYNTSAIRKVNAKVDEVKGVMRDNVDLALANVEQLNEIDAKSADIEASSRQFHHNAKKVKCAMCAQYWKMILIGVVIAIVIIVIIAVVATR